MIHELLSVGENNARTGRELAEVLDCNIRVITLQIEKERRAGYPICATSETGRSGYFLAAGPKDLERYCNRLTRRANEMEKTVLVLSDTLKNLEAQELIDEWGMNPPSTGDQEPEIRQ